MASAQIIKVDDSDSSLLIKRYLSTNWSNTEVLLSNATSLPAYSDTYGGSREPALTVMYNRSKPFLSHLSSEIIDHITVWVSTALFPPNRLPYQRYGAFTRVHLLHIYTEL